MIEKPPKITGKTYSLFGEFESTNEFYKFIDDILDKLLLKYEDINILLDILKLSGKRKKYYDQFISENPILKNSGTLFTSFAPGVNEHIKQQSFLIFRDSVMRLKEWQYHLFMLEFALINRTNKINFKKCDIKIALLPHCLRDLSKDCKATVNGIDYQCKHCSKNCFINEASKILTDKGIEPYIWMSANLRSILRKNNTKEKTLGILGIACIPELIRGMHSCQKKGIPVVGLPLDANRCIRWMGNFNPNSINIEMLEELVS